MGTRTGGFPIGFRRGWSDWQKDTAKLAQWGKQAGFDAIDLGKATAEDIKTLNTAGLKVGSADLLDFFSIMHADAGKRKEVIAANVAYIKEVAPLGAKTFFTVVIPGDATKSRKENHAIAIESYAPIAQAANAAGAKIVLEGWPGGGSLPNLCCNPESYRSFMKDLGSPAMGVNYDPSHLIRMGIDHVRFVKEFAPKIFHVHGKDTEIMTEAIYEVGLYQSHTTEGSRGFGEWAWRYTIPGHGITRWIEVFKTLKGAGFKGTVSVELEDENFNGSEDGEKAGLLHSLAFLRGA